MVFSRRQALTALAISSLAWFLPPGTVSAKSSKYLVVYFSRTGNTRTVANFIQKALDCDILELTPKVPYPTDYQRCVDLAKKEQKEDARPKIATQIPDLSQYSTIFVGYPNWWGTMPMLMFTFFETHNFSGKTIIPFCTHGGSAMGVSESDIKRLCPKAKLLKGLPIKGSQAQESEKKVKMWLSDFGLVEAN